MGAGQHIDVPLSNLAVKSFDAGEGGFISNEIFPIVGVAKQSDLYYEISKGDFLREHDTKRAPKTKANVVEFSTSSGKYFCDNHALATKTALEDLSNTDKAVNKRNNNNLLITSGILRSKEIRVANTITSISNVGSGNALSTKWSDFISSDPVADVTTGHSFIRSQTGIIANTGIIDHDTLAIIRRHPAILDLFKYVSGGELTNEQIMSVFKIKRLLVGEAVKNTAKEGQTAVMANVWGNNFVLAHIMPATGLETVTFGLGMQWKPDGFATPMQVTRQRFAGAGTENVEFQEAQTHIDEKIVAADLAYAITGTL